MNIDVKVLKQLEEYLPIISLKIKIKEAALDMMNKVKIDDLHNYTRL